MPEQNELTVENPRLERLQCVLDALRAPHARGYKLWKPYKEAVDAAGLQCSYKHPDYGDRHRMKFSFWEPFKYTSTSEEITVSTPAELVPEIERLIALEKEFVQQATPEKYIDELASTFFDHHHGALKHYLEATKEEDRPGVRAARVQALETLVAMVRNVAPNAVNWTALLGSLKP